MTVLKREPTKWQTSNDIARLPFVLRCHVAGCHYGIACRTIDEAWREKVRHRCPRRLDGDIMESGPSIINTAWTQLDAQVDEIYAVAPLVHVATLELAKARARGKAEILALLMAPYYCTADEISVEAAARAQARRTGAEHRTLGLDPRQASADIELAKARREEAR